MSLSKCSIKDKLIWGPSKKGVFIVMSTYFLELERKKAVRKKVVLGESSMDSRWSSIWDLEVLGVVKVFLWKVGNNLLTTKKNLFHRKIVEDPNHPICLREVETMMHALWRCRAANDIWVEGQSYVLKILPYTLGKVDGKIE